MKVIEITEQLEHYSNLPTLPTLALKIIELANDSDADMGEVCKYISLDPALSVKLLKVANSPLYRSRRSATNIRQAASILGTHAVASIALSFSLINILQEQQAKKKQIDFDRAALWRRSITSALASRSLGQHFGLTSLEDLFLAGLLQDIGVFAFLTIAPSEYIPIITSVSNHSTLLKAEQRMFNTGHDEVGYSLMKKWNLPDYICVACLISHSKPMPTESCPTISSCVAVSGYIADYFLDPEEGEKLTLLTQMAKSWLNLGSTELMEILNIMEEHIASVEDLFDITIHNQAKISGVMSEAKALLEIHSLSKFREIEEKSQHDGLTGARNRAYFDETIYREFILSSQQGVPLTLAMIDLDHFKNVNDTYGHQAGDEILIATVKTILDHIRPDDSLCRYGGEEFALILPGTSLVSAKILALRLKDSIAENCIYLDDGRTISITASIGIAAIEGIIKRAKVADLIKSADCALYSAKNSGRNKVCCNDLALY